MDDRLIEELLDRLADRLLPFIIAKLSKGLADCAPQYQKASISDNQSESRSDSSEIPDLSVLQPVMQNLTVAGSGSRELDTHRNCDPQSSPTVVCRNTPDLQ